MTASHSFIIVCEGACDREVAVVLGTRVLNGLADWTTPESFSFRGLERTERLQSWAGLKRLAAQVPRHLGHKPGGWGPDSETAWRALHLAKARAPDGVVLLRDCDGFALTEKQRALASAVSAFRGVEEGAPLPVAIGAAFAKVEAWLLAGQQPELSTRESLRQELGFDPISSAEQLTATDAPAAKRSAKALLHRLATVEAATEALRDAPFEQLVDHGKNTGLLHFLKDLRCKLGVAVVAHIPDVSWCQCSATGAPTL